MKHFTWNMLFSQLKHTRYTVYTVLHSIFTYILPQGVTQGENPHKKLHTVLQNSYIPCTLQQSLHTYFIRLHKEINYTICIYSTTQQYVHNPTFYRKQLPAQTKTKKRLIPQKFPPCPLQVSLPQKRKGERKNGFWVLYNRRGVLLAIEAGELEGKKVYMGRDCYSLFAARTKKI